MLLGPLVPPELLLELLGPLVPPELLLELPGLPELLLELPGLPELLLELLGPLELFDVDGIVIAVTLGKWFFPKVMAFGLAVTPTTAPFGIAPKPFPCMGSAVARTTDTIAWLPNVSASTSISTATIPMTIKVSPVFEFIKIKYLIV
jgi:hypothetical protein